MVILNASACLIRTRLKERIVSVAVCVLLQGEPYWHVMFMGPNNSKKGEGHTL